MLSLKSNAGFFYWFCGFCIMGIIRKYREIEAGHKIRDNSAENPNWFFECDNMT